MSFVKKTWEDRISEYPTRRKIIDVDSGDEKMVDVERAEGEVAKAGTPLSAKEFNGLEERVAAAFEEMDAKTLRYTFDPVTATLNFYTNDYEG